MSVEILKRDGDKLLVKADSFEIEVMMKDGVGFIWGLNREEHLMKSEVFKKARMAQESIASLAKSANIGDLEKSYKREIQHSILRANRHEMAANVLGAIGNVS